MREHLRARDQCRCERGAQSRKRDVVQQRATKVDIHHTPAPGPTKIGVIGRKPWGVEPSARHNYPNQSIHDRKVPLIICKGAWQSPNWKSRRMTRRSNGLSGVVEELPAERSAFRPTRAFCPNEELAVRACCDRRMLPIDSSGRRRDRRGKFK